MSKKVTISENLWRVIRQKACEREKTIKSIVEDAIVIWLLLDECGPELDIECVKKMLIKRGGRVVWTYKKLTGKELDLKTKTIIRIEKKLEKKRR